MKILLAVTPASSKSFDTSRLILSEPLAHEYIGAGVRADHDVKILDLRVDSEPGFRETLESFQPDILGCSSYTSEVNVTKKMCAEAKKLLPDILTVVGGIHAFAIPSDFFEEYIDVVVIGEGVEVFKKICQRHETRKSFEDIENIYYRKNSGGDMIFTRQEPFPELDSLPIPARELTAHIRDRYTTYLSETLVPTASIRGSAGCLFRCNFCVVSSFRGHKMYRRSIDKIVNELAQLTEPFVAWVDDELLIEPERAVALARAIGGAGIKKEYACFGRADTIVKHPQVIEEWARVGLSFVNIGMESHRENDLKAMRKGSSLSKSEEALRICHDNGVEIRGSLMVMPDFDKKDFRGIAKYTRELGVDMPAYSIFTPLPGTELFEEKKAELTTGDYDLFDVMHSILPTKLPLKKFYKELAVLPARSMTFRNRLRLLRKMEPKARMKLIKVAQKMRREIKKYYLHHTG